MKIVFFLFCIVFFNFMNVSYAQNISNIDEFDIIDDSELEDIASDDFDDELDDDFDDLASDEFDDEFDDKVNLSEIKKLEEKTDFKQLGWNKKVEDEEYKLLENNIDLSKDEKRFQFGLNQIKEKLSRQELKKQIFSINLPNNLVKSDIDLSERTFGIKMIKTFFEDRLINSNSEDEFIRLKKY